MQYNSQKDPLILPEYGRNIQMLIRLAQKADDPVYRQHLVDRIVDLMHQMNPQGKNIDDYTSKLWKDVFRIANYDLEVNAPTGEKPTPEADRKKPDLIGYPKTHSKFRHYGSNVQKLIKKAMNMEEGPKRDSFARIIGSYMKLAYRTWNKEHYASDEVIKQDLLSMSEGILKIQDNVQLDDGSSSLKRKKRISSLGSNGKSRKMKKRK